MRSLASFGLVAALGVASGACSSEADVVVRRTEGGVTEPNINVTLVSGCRPGLYCGTFEGSTVPVTDPAAIPSPVHGKIQFVLAESRQGEFLTVTTNSYLEGTTETQIPFSADVSSNGGDCREGQIHSTLNGTFELLGGLPMTGSVDGNYSAEEALFTGSWDSQIVILESNGTWSAALSQSDSCP